MEKNISISLSLLHPSVSDFEEALISTIGLHTYTIKDKYSFDAKLYIDENKHSEPEWVPFIKEGFDEIPRIENTYNGAVMICRVENRFFAIAFGNGRYLLNPSYKEHRFGLKVAMTLFPESGLRSASTKRNLEDSSIHTICQSSRDSSLEELRVDADMDKLNTLGGILVENESSERIEGKDYSLSIKSKFNFKTLYEKLRIILVKYQSEVPEHFKSYLTGEQIVTDSDLVSKLDDLLLKDIKSDQGESVIFSPPVFIDMENINGFFYTKSFPRDIQEIELGLYLDSINIQSIFGGNLYNIQTLKDTYIGYKPSDITIIRWAWPLYNCLDHEIKFEGRFYLLSSGCWYHIDDKNIEKYDKIIQRYSIDASSFPLPKPNENEQDYNMRFAVADANSLLMDRRLILYDSAKSPVEFCDVLKNNGMIIHIKKAKGSSVLSHLFSQGAVSARLLNENDRFKSDLQEMIITVVLEKHNITKQLITLIQTQLNNETEGQKQDGIEDVFLNSKISQATLKEIINEVEMYYRLIRKEGIKPAKLTVVYAIIGKFSDKTKFNIPYFSKVNFDFHASLLKKLGYKPAIAFIPVSEQSSQ